MTAPLSHPLIIWRDRLRAILLPVIAGVIVAILLGLYLAQWQYHAIATSLSYAPSRALFVPIAKPILQPNLIQHVFTADQSPLRVDAAYQARVRFKFMQTPTLLLPQYWVTLGMMLWLIMRIRSPFPYREGLIIGGCVATIEGVLAFLLNTPLSLIVILMAMLIAVGYIGGWSNHTGHLSDRA